MNLRDIWFLDLLVGITILPVAFFLAFGLLGFGRDVLFSLIILLNSLIYLTGLGDIKRGLKRGIAHTFVGGMFSSIIALYVILKKLVDLLYMLIYQSSLERLNLEDLSLILFGIVGAYSMFVSYKRLKKGEKV